MRSAHLFPSVRATSRVATTTALLALAASVVPGPTRADVPDPIQCTVTPGDLLGPNGGLIASPLFPVPVSASVNTITVRNNAGNPIANASVVVLLGANTPTCAAAVLTGTTNASGVVTITIGAGGCYDQIPACAVIKVNGVTFRAYPNVKSPDYDGASGNRTVNLSDLTQFANQFNGVEPAECHDYDNDEDCDLGDLVVFGSAFSGANSCP